MSAIKILPENADLLMPTKEIKLLDLFCSQYPSVQTQRAYRHDLDGLISWLNECEIHPLKVKPMILNAYITSQREKKSVNTLNRALGTIKAFYRWLTINEYLTVNPADSLKALKGGPEKPTPAFTEEETINMLASPNVLTLEGNRDRLVLVFLFYLGLRRNEIGRIRIKDIQETSPGNYAVSVIGKGNKRREVPLSPLVFNEVVSYRARYEFASGKSFAKADYLFQRERIKSEIPMDGSTVYRIVERTSEAIGIERRGPHSCRVTVITQLIDKDISMKNVADFVGHSSINTTNGYVNRAKSFQNPAAQTLNFEPKTSNDDSDSYKDKGKS